MSLIPLWVHTGAPRKLGWSILGEELCSNHVFSLRMMQMDESNAILHSRVPSAVSAFSALEANAIWRSQRLKQVSIVSVFFLKCF